MVEPKPHDITLASHHDWGTLDVYIVRAILYIWLLDAWQTIFECTDVVTSTLIKAKELAKGVSAFRWRMFRKFSFS